MLKNHDFSLVYIVDDEFAVRDSLTLLLESTGQAAKSFSSAEDFLNAYNPEYPGCLILDVRMQGMSGLELQEQLNKRKIDIPIIFISGHAHIPDSAKAFRAGAIDFLEKPFDMGLLIDRVNEAINKDTENKAKLLAEQTIQERMDRLTVREKEVLNLILTNHSNKEVARILDISHRTIEVHRSRIMEKMEAENISELMLMIINHHHFLGKNLQ